MPTNKYMSKTAFFLKQIQSFVAVQCEIVQDC